MKRFSAHNYMNFSSYMNCMKSGYLLVLVLLAGAWIFSGCATIVGGSRYNAHIVVLGNPKADIIYKGNVIGTGSTMVKVKRKEANRFSFSVKAKDCDEQVFAYRSRKFKTGASICSVLFWTGLTEGGIPIPYGIVVDILTGALWKPDVAEVGVSKSDYKNFNYVVRYSSCETPPPPVEEPAQQLDAVFMKNGNIFEGYVIEVIPDDHIVLETPEGNVLELKMSDIEKITKMPVR